MEEKTKCGICHTAHKNKDLIEFDGVLLCRSCYEVEVTHCAYCGEAIWRNDKAVDILLDELDRVGNLIKEVENEIAHESTKYPVISVAKVKLFLEQFVNGDIKEFYFREKLIEVFVKEIKVYNDKITVSYNVQDGDFFDYSTICFSSDLAGAEGLEPSARGFGDRCSTN